MDSDVCRTAILWHGGEDQGKLEPVAWTLCFGYFPLEPTVKITENNLKSASILVIPVGENPVPSHLFSKNTSPTLSKH